MDEFEIELKKDFLQEAHQILDDVESAFLQLESEPEDKDNLNKIFRFAHNLKGTSRAVGFGDIAEFTHEVENLILMLVEDTLKVSPSVVNLLLECKDRLSEMIDALESNLETCLSDLFNNSELIDRLQLEKQKDHIENEAEAKTENKCQAEDVRQVRSEDSAKIGDEAAAEDTNEFSHLEDEEFRHKDIDSFDDFQVPSSDEFEEFQKNDPVIEKELEVVKKTQPETSISKKQDRQNVQKNKNDESIRVKLSKVEKLIDFVGEMVILQTVLEQVHQTSQSSSLIKNTVNQLGKISREIQEISMGLRMIPLKSTFQKMGRIVRDTSNVLGKDVELLLEGEDTEIDKTVLEHLSDPLVHIIRNAIDHGLETPEERIKLNKKSQGIVELWAYHSGNQLVIQISDDGKGIDPDKVLSKAIEKKIVPANTSLNEKQILDLIFHPGFSTKDEISEVSGRGVGMDVVRTNIERLSGTISLTSVKGMGTNFKISLPLTMAIVDAMVIDVRGHSYIIPLTQIKEALQIDSTMVEDVTGYGKILNSRGETFPLINLSDHLGLSSFGTENPKPIAIIVNHPDVHFAIKVDNIKRQQQVVVKKLGKEIKTMKCVVASSILGDGKPAFILDLMEFVPSVKDITMEQSLHKMSRTGS